MAIEAVRLATKYMTPVMLLTDGSLANGAEPWKIPKMSDFAPFPVNAHANGAASATALYRFPITAEKVRGAPMVASPLGLLDCSTVADGAAAVRAASTAPRPPGVGAAEATDDAVRYSSPRRG